MTVKPGAVQTVLKIGGGLLGQAGAFDRMTDAVANAARGQRVLVVPGGGPFADAVRQMFRRIKISEDAAHWMAILGMDQYAFALAARIPGAGLVERAGEIAPSLEAGRIPVLAPFRWLREEDPLPHSWDATSDSIAAWIAGALGARRLVLLKPATRDSGKLVDPYFLRALARGVEHLVVTVDALEQLGTALDAGDGQGRPRPGGQR